MIRRSFITTVLVALGLGKAVAEEDNTFRIMSEDEACVVERWELQPDGSYSYNFECGPGGHMQKIDVNKPAGLRTRPPMFTTPYRRFARLRITRTGT